LGHPGGIDERGGGRDPMAQGGRAGEPGPVDGQAGDSVDALGIGDVEGAKCLIANVHGSRTLRALDLEHDLEVVVGDIPLDRNRCDSEGSRGGEFGLGPAYPVARTQPECRYASSSNRTCLAVRLDAQHVLGFVQDAHGFLVLARLVQLLAFSTELLDLLKIAGAKLRALGQGRVDLFHVRGAFGGEDRGCPGHCEQGGENGDFPHEIRAPFMVLL